MGEYDEKVKEIIEEKGYRDISIKELEKIKTMNKYMIKKYKSELKENPTRIYSIIFCEQDIDAVDLVIKERRKELDKKKQKRDDNTRLFLEKYPPADYDGGYESIFMIHLNGIMVEYNISEKDEWEILDITRNLNSNYLSPIHYKSDTKNEYGIPLSKIPNHPDYKESVDITRLLFSDILEILKKYKIKKEDIKILKHEFHILITPSHLYKKRKILNKKETILVTIIGDFFGIL